MPYNAMENCNTVVNHSLKPAAGSNQVAVHGILQLCDAYNAIHSHLYGL